MFYALVIYGYTDSSKEKGCNMNKPYGRKTKKIVGTILHIKDREAAMSRLMEIPADQLIGHLFSHFYHKNELIRFRATAAMGQLGRHLAKNRMEKARIVLRRIMWNLNDESGGIGWGSPEAMGEILYNSPELALEFKSILFSYLDPGGNFIEHEMLQRGVIWGVGTYLDADPDDLTPQIEGLLFSHLHSDDPVKRGYAVRALSNGRRFNCSIVPENIIHDEQIILIFDGWNLEPVKIRDMALSCEGGKIFA